MSVYHSKVYGIVQGVGFRPFVDRLAAKHQIKGSVANKGSYVEIYAQGSETSCRAFFHGLKAEAPERSVILKIDTHPCEHAPFSAFSIIESEHETGNIFVSPDIATCDKCRAELYDPHDRRYLHPFINCTACGPRLTILDAMPYDRERTSMKEFPMCDACHAEYTDPESRRYDAQPVCCNDCGPEVYIIGNGPGIGHATSRGKDAIYVARKALADGKIVAIKGIGGFHLACDAHNETAVSRLRKKKFRPVKPFAVMLRDMEAVRKNCVLEPGEEELLIGHQKPILLLRKRTGETLAPSVAPGNPKIGVMLPYNPVQMLLFDYPDDLQPDMPDALVMTSGNPSGAPICRSDEDALASLAGFSDLMLSHNRKIRIRADDTVMDYFGGAPYMIRRSRGWAPLPIMLSGEWEKKTGAVLAIGGELKNTFCVGCGPLLYPSPYVGDLSDLRTVQALRETTARLLELLETRPEVIVCDEHPRYNSVTAAREIAKQLGVPLVTIQHHAAHILSCMAENDVPPDGRVIGVSFDGTGYGSDGTIWGGEILDTRYDGFTRLGSITPFPQAGGDKSSVEGWRNAVSMLYLCTGSAERTAELARKLHLCGEDMLKAQLFMLTHHVNAITSTSAGRLFDAVSALLGIRQASTFEGEAAMFLQYAAERGRSKGSAALSTMEPIKAVDGGPLQLRTDRLFERLAEKRLEGEDPDALAFAFHAGLAALIAAGCREAHKQTGLKTVALSGGVFQNTLLLELTIEALEKDGFTVLRHHLIAPNDGGIALGQAAYAMMKLSRGL